MLPLLLLLVLTAVAYCYYRKKAKSDVITSTAQTTVKTAIAAPSAQPIITATPSVAPRSNVDSCHTAEAPHTTNEVRTADVLTPQVKTDEKVATELPAEKVDGGSSSGEKVQEAEPVTPEPERVAEAVTPPVPAAATTPPSTVTPNLPEEGIFPLTNLKRSTEKADEPSLSGEKVPGQVVVSPNNPSGEKIPLPPVVAGDAVKVPPMKEATTPPILPIATTPLVVVTPEVPIQKVPIAPQVATPEVRPLITTTPKVTRAANQPRTPEVVPLKVVTPMASDEQRRLIDGLKATTPRPPLLANTTTIQPKKSAIVPAPLSVSSKKDKKLKKEKKAKNNEGSSKVSKVSNSKIRLRTKPATEDRSKKHKKSKSSKLGVVS